MPGSDSIHVERAVAAEAFAPAELEPAPTCHACGREGGEVAFEGVEDFAFGNIDGRWSFRRCPGCGTLRLDPRPTRAVIARAYRSYTTHAEPLDLFASQSRRRRAGLVAELRTTWGYELPALPSDARRRHLATRAAFLVRHLPKPQRSARLLDVGCGNGEWLVFMRGLGWEVEGLEFDPAAVARARSRELRVNLGSPETTDYPEGAFDAITLAHLIEHVHAPELVLARVSRWLASGGTLWIATPNAAASSLERYGRHARVLEAPRHLQLFTEPGLARLLEHSGLIVQRPAHRLRSARWFLRASAEIRAGRPLAWPERRWLALVTRWIDWRVRSHPERAEELVLIGRKP